MKLHQFHQSLTNNQPNEGLSVHLKALWHDAKGDWHTAHSLIDQLNDQTSARVHAYLHRKEGDSWNAAYWYKRAGEKQPEVSLQEEWDMLVKRFSDK